MTRFFWREALRLGLVGVVVGGTITTHGLAFVFGSTALAQVVPNSQIVPDSSLGTNNSIVNSSPNGLDTITGGATQGSNLFHSFQQFSIPNGRAALFNNGANIQNIITRVTGSSRSDIDGILATARDTTANLFLLNPNGIVFGQNARLRIGGSFIATTASSIDFADGTQFSASPGEGAPLLTVSVPLGLQFGTSPGEIVNRSQATDRNNFTVGLQVQSGKTLGLIGGNVNLEGGWLTAAGGRVELGAVATPGVVGINTANSGVRFSFPTELVLGDISLANSAVVDVRAGGGGSIAVNTRNLSLTGGSELIAGIGANQGLAGAVAGDIDIYAQDTIAIEGVGQFPSGVFSSGIFNNVESGATGKGGNINITTGSLFLKDRAVITANTTAQGDAGNIQIAATNPNDSVLFESGSFIQTDSFSQSSAGNVTITADGRVSFVGFDSNGIGSGVFSRVATQGSTGKGGNIAIKARSLSLSEGAQINTGTSGQGKGGDIALTAGSLSLSKDSVVVANTNFNSQGDAGKIQITATDPNESLVVSDGAYIQSDTFGSGSAGDVTITADGQISFVGVGSTGISSGVFSRVATQEGTGKGGNIAIKARSLSLSEAAQINTGTSGKGKGGDIALTAGSLSLSKDSVVLSSTNTNSQGDAGKIQITATDPNESLVVNGGAYIQSDSFGSGSAGDVTITADGQISFVGVGSTGISSGVFSRVATQEGTGKGGNIAIKARSLSLSEAAQINTSTSGQGKGGDIALTADSLFLSKGSAVISSTNPNSQGDAGNIQITATNPNDSLVVNGGAYIQSDSFGSGSAGDVSITADGRVSFAELGTNNVLSGVFSTLKEIPAQQSQEVKGDRQGGDINIKARSLSLSDGGLLAASTLGAGNAGNITVDVSEAIFTGVNQNKSGIFGTVEATGKGNSGNISLTTDTLLLKDGAQINAISLGDGNAGNVTVDARDWIIIDGVGSANPGAIGSGIESPGTGSGGNVSVTTGSLELKNGGVISSSTLSGEKNAGNISITARDNISIDGVAGIGFSDGAFDTISNSGIYSATQKIGKGDGGNIDITTDSLSLTRGGAISASSSSQGNAGNVTITARNNISIDGTDGLRFSPSGIFSVLNQVPEFQGTRQGGDLNIKARSLSLSNSGQLNSSSAGQGDAGNINVEAGSVRLNSGKITVETTSGNGGDIQLQIGNNLTLRNNSQISTTAGTAQQPGNGGNITIDSPLIIAALVNELNEDSDITANAFSGTGGNIQITTQGIFGIRPREATPDTNDITASSQLGIGGTIQLNSLEIDPSRDLVELPTQLVDASTLVASGCPSGAENRFAVTGRGGLPPAPGDKLSSDALLTDWATLQTPETANRATVETTNSKVINAKPNSIVEATSWQFDRNGAIILTSGDATASNRFDTTPSSCPNS